MSFQNLKKQGSVIMRILVNCFGTISLLDQKPSKQWKEEQTNFKGRFIGSDVLRKNISAITFNLVPIVR